MSVHATSTNGSEPSAVEGTASGGCDLDVGNAAIEVAIPLIAAEIFATVTSNGSDAPQLLRVTVLVTNSWFEAVAPYSDTMVGVSSSLGRRPSTERTERNRNVALLVACRRVLDAILPGSRQVWREMLTSVGLDPDDDRRNLHHPVGIGNLAGDAVLEDRLHDGMNQLGDEGGCEVLCQPLADYTGYVPENTAFALTDPSRWQPDVTSNGTGTFTSQVAATPQLRVTRPYSYPDPGVFRSPRPRASQFRNRALYSAQARRVVEQSAAMTDEQKCTAELFNNKIRGLGFSTVFAAQSGGLSVEEFVILDFLANVAAFDTAIAVWQEKYRHDAVRPFSAVRKLYGGRRITAWGGPGRGTTRIPGSQWHSYLGTANHPEYPSASAAFCRAQADVTRSYLETDELNWEVPFPAGSSTIEPGVTPAQDLTLRFPTWSDLAERCGRSRFWSGVHFEAAVPAGAALGAAVAEVVFPFIMSHVEGTRVPGGRACCES